MDAAQFWAQPVAPWLSCPEAARHLVALPCGEAVASEEEHHWELSVQPGNLCFSWNLAQFDWAAHALVATWPRQGLHAAAP